MRIDDKLTNNAARQQQASNREEEEMPSDVISGWERSRRVHFDEIATLYDKARPGYPDELFQDILAYSGHTAGGNALEIGAGTGKATLPFLEAGYSITAVEINPNMAVLLAERYYRWQGLRVIVSSFEEAELAEDSFNLIFAANSYHWVDPEIGTARVYRLLKNGGTIALFRYNAVPAIGDELYEEIQAAYAAHYYVYYTSSPSLQRVERSDFWTPHELQRGFRIDNLQSYGFVDVTGKLYDGSRVFETDDYIEYLETMSDHRALPESNRHALYNAVREAIMRHGGKVQQDYIYQLYMGRKEGD